VVDFAGIRVGTVDEHGEVRDFAGIHIGAVRADDPTVAVDFAGIRLGRVVPVEG
jgi:hypothetical protein